MNNSETADPNIDLMLKSSQQTERFKFSGNVRDVIRKVKNKQSIRLEKEFNLFDS